MRWKTYRSRGDAHDERELLLLAVAYCHELMRMTDDEFGNLAVIHEFLAFSPYPKFMEPDYVQRKIELRASILEVVVRQLQHFFRQSSQSFRQCVVVALAPKGRSLARRLTLEHSPRGDVPRFDPHNISEKSFYEWFRIRRSDLPRLMAALKIDDMYKTVARTVSPGPEALLLLMRRLAFPNRWTDMHAIFGRSDTHMSLLFNQLVLVLRKRFRTALTLSTRRLSPERLEFYEACIHKRGGPLPQVFGFIDGTFRGCARPCRMQEACFSGYYRAHGFKFVTVVTPDGHIQHVMGPAEGRVNDAKMYNESKIPELLKTMKDTQGRLMVIFGDSGFPICPQLVRPHVVISSDDSNAAQNRRTFNHTMSSVRQCVEWSYGDVSRNFKFLQHEENLKSFIQPVATYYWVSTFLTNCLNCLYGSVASGYFACRPIELEEYCDSSILEG